MVLREELLKTRLCDLLQTLEVDMNNGPLSPYIKQVRRELRRKGILFEPYFWASTEWFCPDGYSGVGVPFFLLHPALRRLEADKMGFVDGRNKVEILKIIRHEVGHAIENAYRLKRHPLRVRTFGSHLKTYPHSYRPNPFSRSYVRHLGMGYAQSHPDEDFAETFAVWLNPNSDWRNVYRGTPAYVKLESMNQIMKEIKGLSTSRGQRGCVDPLSSYKITLAEYYRRKQLHFRLPARKRLFERFSSTETKRGQVGLPEFLRHHEKEVVGKVSEALGQPRHLVRRVVLDFIHQGSNLKLNAKTERERKLQTLNYVTEGSLIYLEKGLDRVVL